MGSKEKRAYVRGDLSFQVTFRVITQEEYRQRKAKGDQLSFSNRKEFIFDSTDADDRDTDSPFDARLANFLIMMDRKLNYILNLLEKDQVDLFNQGLGLNISGSGMKIRVDDPVEPGKIINTNIVLSMFPFVRIDVYGEVVNVIPVNEDGTGGYHLGIRFLDMDPEDRENIIACIFQKERKAIRKRKSGDQDHEKIGQKNK